MKTIKKFKEFIFEKISPSIDKLKGRKKERLISEFNSAVFKKLQGAGRIEEISFKRSENPISSRNYGNYLFIKFSDIKDPIIFPFVVYDEYMEDVDYLQYIGYESENYIEYVENKIGNNFWNSSFREDWNASSIGNSFFPLIGGIINCYYDKFMRETPFLDLSKFGYKDLNEYKDLLRMGLKDISSERMIKSGTIKFSNEWGREYMVHTNGYLRYSTGGRVSLISKNPKILKPIETADDLSAKFRILYLFAIKNHLFKRMGVSDSDSKRFISSYYSEDPEEYKNVYNDLIHKNTELLAYLTPPRRDDFSRMIRGAKMLKSLGVFEKHWM